LWRSSDIRKGIPKLKLFRLNFLLYSSLQHVLTAAHCVSWGKEVLSSKVILGGHNLDQAGNPDVITRGIKKIKVHIKYNSTTTDFDIALVISMKVFS